eukprot:TRINITY_DN362_c0_g1_i3.p1 TRINITY_DN362_c0_g1~~TRINITY_DN362_c0_g1_i3.p1  ORF type:complete len:591 (-),score=82.23 TRINITY_DN362_c0_g1_i3:1569-3341(-)
MRLRSTLIRKLPSVNVFLSQKRYNSDLKWSYTTGPNPPFPLMNITLGQLAHKAANRFEDREALVSRHQGIRKSFAQIYEDSLRLAGAFSNLGFKPGDMIGIWAPNCAEWLITQVAVAMAGCVLVNLNPAYQKEELQYVLNKVPIKGIITPSSLRGQCSYEAFTAWAPELKTSKPGELNTQFAPHLKSLIIIKSSEDKRKIYKGAFCFQSLLESGGTAKDTARINELTHIIQADDMNNIQFTSGTTGRPKGVMLSHFNTINNAALVSNRLGIDTEAHIISLWVPFFHTFGCVGGSLSCLINGAKLVLPSVGFNPHECLKSIEEEKCTFLFGTPTMFLAVMVEQKKLNMNVSSVYKALSGGALFLSEASSLFEKHLNTKTIYNIYGATENSPATFCSISEDPLDLRVNTVGPPFSHVEAKIVDQNGKILPVNTPGELWVRTPGLMHGYYEDEKANKKSIGMDRYYHSGDLALMTEKGYCKIIGRIDDMVNRGGENLYPKEIEDILSKHPNVLETYIVGVPDDKMGEELCAWIHLEEGAKEFDVKEYLKGKISHFKIPKYCIYVTEFPKTLSGKVKKFEMKATSIEILRLKSK